MMKPVFKINGNEITPPINYPELSIEIRTDKDNPDYKGEVSTNVWDIGLGDKRSTKDGARMINHYIAGGLTGGFGIFEGLNYTIQLKDGNITDNLFDGYLDLTTGSFLCKQVNATAIETSSVDWLNEVADSFTFDFLAATVQEGGAGLITQEDYVLTQYLIEKPVNVVETAVISVTMFTITLEIYDIGSTIISDITKLLSDPFMWGIVSSIAINFIRILIVIKALVDLLDKILVMLFQPIKYKAGMYLHTLCSKGAEHLGYEFQSTLLENTEFSYAAIIPESYEQTSNEMGRREGLFNHVRDLLVGIQDPRFKGDLKGFYKGTFGDLLRELKTMFNAKVIIKDNILRLERIDYTDNSSDIYQLPKIDRENIPVRYNTYDLKAHYDISFTTDLNDTNVWQNYKGTNYQIITKPKHSTLPDLNKSNVLMKGQSLNKLNLSRATYKSNLTMIELMVNEVIDFQYRLVRTYENTINRLIFGVNKILFRIFQIIKRLKTAGILKKGVRNIKPINFITISGEIRAKKLEKRIGLMIMESDFVNVPKLVMLDSDYKNGTKEQYTKLHKRNTEVISAKHLWQNYHIINSFVQGDTNQREIYELDDIYFCIDDYRKVKNNKTIRDSDGTLGELISLKYNPIKERASITYKVANKYTTNLKETRIEPDGK